MTSPAVPTQENLADSVTRCIDANDLRQGLALCRELNARYPAYAYGWYLASFVLRRARNLRDAVAASDRALALDDAIRYRLHKARCLYESGDHAGVAQIVEPLARQRLDEAQLHAELGALFLLLARHDDSLWHYSRAVVLEPRDAEHRFNEAALLRYVGRLQEAEAGFDAALRLKPTEYEAYNARAQLRRQTAESNHVEGLREVIARTTDTAGLVQLHYALAKELEDLGEDDAAFASLSAGATLKRRHMRYDVHTDLHVMAAIESTFDASVFSDLPTTPSGPGPIFVIGMPRTGTTLVERLLGSHPDVQSLGELNTFGLEVMRLARTQSSARGGPVSTGASPLDQRAAFVRATRAIDFRALGEAYLSAVAPLRDERAFFVDKLPFNFLYAGLIRLALPQARIVHLRRHPLDTCYAVYKQLFKDAYPYSYDLEELARYYVAYRRLMDHWHRVLPGAILDVQYEDVVADVTAQAQRLLEFCGLPWHADVLRFHENRAASTTASAVQVRQPIYLSSVGRWQRVAKQLEPARRILLESGIELT